jgi:hypothetical protein
MPCNDYPQQVPNLNPPRCECHSCTQMRCQGLGGSLQQVIQQTPHRVFIKWPQILEAAKDYEKANKLNQAGGGYAFDNFEAIYL